MSLKQVILLVEDEEDDIVMVRRALGLVDKSVELNVVNNGEECMGYLRGVDEFQGRPTPNLIILDLNMGRMDGFEVLEEIKNDSYLKRIPVTVLTSSSRDKDIERCYQLGANSYVCKEVDPHLFTEKIKKIQEYWFSVCCTP